MQPGLADVARDVEADPGAVFEAHGAESVDELVAGESAPSRDSASDRAVSNLFEGDLDRPERRPDAGDTERGTATDCRESSTSPAVLADLERAIDAEDGADPADVEELESLDDADVADALAAAEDLDDAELPESVPEEWR